MCPGISSVNFVFSLSLNFRKYFHCNSRFQHSAYLGRASIIFPAATMQYKLILAALAAAQLSLAAPVPGPEAMGTREAEAAPEEVRICTTVLLCRLLSDVSRVSTPTMLLQRKRERKASTPTILLQRTREKKEFMSTILPKRRERKASTFTMPLQ